MAKLKVVRASNARWHPCCYRGVERPSPLYNDELPDNHPLNNLAIDVGSQMFVTDLQSCMALVDGYRQLEVPERFEVIELADEVSSSELDGEFMGFDLAHNYSLSLIPGRLAQDGGWVPNFPPEDVYWAIRPLIRLLRAYFVPQLNVHCLFDTYEVATVCLESMTALQRIRPNLWEGDDFRFWVIGVWRVYGSIYGP